MPRSCSQPLYQTDLEHALRGSPVVKINFPITNSSVWSQISVRSWLSCIFYKICGQTEPLFTAFTVIFKHFLYDFIYFDSTESFDELVKVYRLVLLYFAS